MHNPDNSPKRNCLDCSSRFPQADANGDGKLTQEEFDAARKKFQQTTRGKGSPAATAQRMPVFDPGWEKENFPPHAVSLKTPEEIMAIYKSGLKARSAAANDATSFPKPGDGIMRIVGTGHSFMRPGYVTLPFITRAAGFDQPLCLHTGGGVTGSSRYKWEQENGIFQFDRKPLPKLLAAISNAKWEAMVWGPTQVIVLHSTRAGSISGKIQSRHEVLSLRRLARARSCPKLFKLQVKPESEAFFTEAVYDKLSADAIAGFGGLVKTLRESTKEVYILPTHAAMTEAAKRSSGANFPVSKACTR